MNGKSITEEDGMKKRKCVRIHDRRIDRAVARKILKDQGVTLSKRYNRSFANIWRELAK